MYETSQIDAFLRGEWDPGRFTPRPMHHVECPHCGEGPDADPGMVVAWRRASDDLLVFVLRCPDCGDEGVLQLMSGPGAAEEAGPVANRLLGDRDEEPPRG